MLGLDCVDQGTWRSFEPEAGSRSRHQGVDKDKRPMTKASVRSDFVKYMLSKWSNLLRKSNRPDDMYLASIQPYPVLVKDTCCMNSNHLTITRIPRLYRTLDRCPD